MKFPLKEIQSTRTQRPTANSSYPYVEIALGDVAAQHTLQLQLEQVGPALSPTLPSLGPSLGLAPRYVRSLPCPREYPGQCMGQNQPQRSTELQIIMVVIQGSNLAVGTWQRAVWSHRRLVTGQGH